MLAAPLPLMPGASHVHGKLGKLARPDEFEVLLDAPFHRPEDTDALSLKSHQSAPSYPPYNYGIYRIAGEGFHGLALTVLVVNILVVQSFMHLGFAIYDHKTGR